MSSGSSVNDALTAYAEGRMSAQQLVGVVATEYWSQEPGSRSRGLLRPIIDVIEKAHPGTIELSSSSEKPGLAVRLAERPFPKRYEGELRGADRALVGAHGAAP